MEDPCRSATGVAPLSERSFQHFRLFEASGRVCFCVRRPFLVEAWARGLSYIGLVDVSEVSIRNHRLLELTGDTSVGLSNCLCASYDLIVPRTEDHRTMSSL